MKIKNLKVSKKIACLGLVGSFSLSTLAGCGNKQILDFNKSFNVVIEKNDENLSVAGIKAYSDYSGSQVQFVTEDNLRVVTSTFQTQLIKAENEEVINNYTSKLAKEENIIRYDTLQGTAIDYSANSWNKDVIDMNDTYNKAIILSNEMATIVELNTWKDYEDDKIQVKLKDGTCILTNVDKIKLINDEEAENDSLKNYAISLVGSEDKVVFFDKQNTK